MRYSINPRKELWFSHSEPKSFLIKSVMSSGTHSSTLSKYFSIPPITCLSSMFQRFPDFNFLWKFDGETPMSASNIYNLKWLPQTDLLRKWKYSSKRVLRAGDERERARSEETSTNVSGSKSQITIEIFRRFPSGRIHLTYGSELVYGNCIRGSPSRCHSPLRWSNCMSLSVLKLETRVAITSHDTQSCTCQSKWRDSAKTVISVSNSILISHPAIQNDHSTTRSEQWPLESAKLWEIRKSPRVICATHWRKCCMMKGHIIYHLEMQNIQKLSRYRNRAREIARMIAASPDTPQRIFLEGIEYAAKYKVRGVILFFCSVISQNRKKW